MRAGNLLKKDVNGLGVPTGANTLDIAKIAVDAGLLNKGGNGAEMVAAAYRGAHDEVKIRNETMSDGIRADGSFSGQGSAKVVYWC